MRILLISNSARGEAIAAACARSPQKPEIVVASTVHSPGFTALGCEVHVMDIMSFSAIVHLATEKMCDFAFIAPDDPIGAGLADRLEAAGIPCIGPKKSLARIEASKSFARDLMQKYSIDGSPKFRVFTCSSPDLRQQTDSDLRAFMEKELLGNYVVKYDSLKGGKGVKLSEEHLATIEEGVAYALECIDECGTVVIEEKLVGVEFSLLSFVSGVSVVDMPAVQDHKRANVGDTGPNTGGMGTYSDANHTLPFLLPDDLESASSYNRAIAQALLTECNMPYKGILYGGFIATATGVKVIEYNARFGDPEALNVLPLLESDFVAICQSIIDGTLSANLVRFAHKATVCKYIVPESYPEDKKEKGQEVILPEDIPNTVRIFYGDVSQGDSGEILLGGSRAIGVLGIADTISDAEKAAESVCHKISGPVRFRSDIGTLTTIQQRIDTMQKIRSA